MGAHRNETRLPCVKRGEVKETSAASGDNFPVDALGALAEVDFEHGIRLQRFLFFFASSSHNERHFHSSAQCDLLLFTYCLLLVRFFTLNFRP
jgi:hypothetical protein